MVKYSCEYCEDDLGFEPKMCCDGYMCGCMGRPVDPMVCSRECFLLQYPHMANTEEERHLVNDLQYLTKKELIEYLKN